MSAICPHCGHDQTEGDGVLRLPYDENSNAEGEFECEHCKQIFWIRANVTVTWETYPTEEAYELF